jgi:two-component system, cell cycle sensor histidine kinase and response regulator CckA
MTADRSPASDDLARALDGAVYASLRPVLVALAVLFCLFAVAHPLVLPADAAMPMMVLAASSSVIFLVLYGLLHAGRLPGERPSVYAVIVAAVVLTNSLAHLHLVGDPRDTTNLLLFMVGAGFLLLSTRWLLACLALTIVGWVAVANEHPPFEPWARFLFAIVSAAVMSLLVHVVRLRTVLRFEQLRAQLERLVTERTRTLASERNLLRTLVDNLPDGVFVKDVAGRYRLANAAHRRQLGLGSSEELAHRTVLDLTPGAWAQQEAEEDRRVVESATPVLDRVHEIAVGMDTVRLVASKVPVLEPGGAVIGLVGVTRDVTASHEAEQARRLLDQQLQETQKLESLGVLAGGIAHDFNNLLTGVLGNISLARLQLENAEATASHLDGIETSAMRAADLCQQMLAYAGKGRFHEQRLDLGALVADMLPLLRLSVAKGVSLQVDIAPGLPAVWGDPTQMRQVVLNLVLNGSDAISGTGTIEIRVFVVPSHAGLLAEVVPPLEPVEAADYLILEISDTGCGMTPEMQARVFEPFYTTKFTGRGLGLAVVHGIVRGHRGGVRVESAPQLGSTFSVALPSISQAAEPLGTLSPSTDAWRGSGVALVADDEDLVRDVAVSLLQQIGFEVVAVANGREALQAFSVEPGRFGLVILDLTMPIMTGSEALAAIRQIRPDVPVLIMSGYNEQDTPIGAPGRPPTFLHKPFSMQVLRDRLQDALGPAPRRRRE